jgi:peroxiredoxin
MVARTKKRVIAVAFAVAVAGCGNGARPRYPTTPISIVFTEIDGGEVAPQAMRGKVVVVHFFATWSLQSQADVEELRRLRAAHGDRVEIIGVGVDPDGRTLLAPWRQESGVPWWIVTPTPEVSSGASPFGKVNTVPTTFVLDRSGVIRWRHDGPLRPGEIDRVVSQLEARGARP